MSERVESTRLEVATAMLDLCIGVVGALFVLAGGVAFVNYLFLLGFQGSAPIRVLEVAVVCTISGMLAIGYCWIAVVRGASA